MQSEFVPCTEGKSTKDISQNIINSLTDIAANTLPEKTEVKSKELWKNDNVLNSLIAERGKMEIQSASFKEKTNAIKKRIKTLSNKKTKSEAESINNFASKREIEELCRSFKNDNETFAKSTKTAGCDTTKLKYYFKNHFNHRTVNDQPLELTYISNQQTMKQN